MWPLDSRVEAYLRKYQLDRAIEDFNAAIRVSADHAMGFLDRGIAEILQSNLDAALADFQTGLAVDPRNPSVPQSSSRQCADNSMMVRLLEDRPFTHSAKVKLVLTYSRPTV